jgi:glucose/arabinose dehydrogenase
MFTSRFSDRRLVGLAGAIAAVVAVGGDATLAQDREPPRLAATIGVLDKPGYLPFEERFLRQLEVPAGYAVNVFASPGGNLRMMAVAADGSIYATRQEQGDVLLLRDTNADGRADQTRVVASGLKLVHGLAISGSTMYLVAPTTVWSAQIGVDGSLTTPEVLVDDLPDGGQHRARTIRVGPDGRLYIGVGSTCNACSETNDENATLLRMEADGTGRTIFAKGLRHTIGFDWHPDTGELWGMDNGTDWRGNTIPPEELNRIVEGGHYGWPFCYANRRVDTLLNAVPPGGQSREAFCAATVPAAFTYTPHSAPIGMTFYNGAQFADARGDAFVALRGSWNRTPPSGYKVIRIRFEDGRPVAAQDFLTGFRIDPRRSRLAQILPGVTYQFARIAGIVVAADGALLVSDDSNGVVYRVSQGASSAEGRQSAR